MTWGLWGYGVPGPGERTAMPTYYHVTPEHNEESILQHGLDYSKSEWGCPAGEHAGNYFWNNEEDARNHAEGMSGFMDGPQWVVMPFIHEGPVMSDPEVVGERGEGRSFYTTDPIPPEAFHHPKTKEARIMTAAVTVYTQPNCVQCTMTKKQLDKLGIEHTTVDVSADPDAHAYVTGLGYTAAPVVVVNDGEQHWSGFRPDHLKELVSGE